MPPEMSGRGGTIRIGDGPPLAITSWRVNPAPIGRVTMPQAVSTSSGRTQLLYQDLESERTYEVERANIRTTSDPFPDGIDDFGFVRYRPVNYSIRGDLRIALPTDVNLYADIAPGRRGLFVTIEPSGLRSMVPVIIQETQTHLFACVEFSFVASGPLTTQLVEGVSPAQLMAVRSLDPFPDIPANPNAVPTRRSEVLAQQYINGQISARQFADELRRPNEELNAPVEPPKPPRPARRRRLLVPVNVPIEA